MTLLGRMTSRAHVGNDNDSFDEVREVMGEAQEAEEEEEGQAREGDMMEEEEEDEAVNDEEEEDKETAEEEEGEVEDDEEEEREGGGGGIVPGPRSRAGSSSRFRGVCWSKAEHKWTAKRKSKWLGYHATEEAAARAYNVEAARVGLGESYSSQFTVRVVGRCRLTVSKPVLKVPMGSALETIRVT